jgi:DNA replication licensing factor MCM2
MADNFNRKRKFDDMESGGIYEDSEMHDESRPSHPQQPLRRPEYGQRNMDIDDGEKFSEDEESKGESSIIVGDDKDNDSDNVSGDDLMEGMEKDYEHIPELDRYEREGIDDSEVVQEQHLDAEGRAQVDRLLNERDRHNAARGRRLPVAMLEEDYSEDDDLARQLRKEREKINREFDDDAEDDAGKYIDMEEAKGNVAEWLQQPRTIKFIRHQFASFLRNFKDEKGADVYEQRITEMCSNNKQSLEVNYSHLSLKIPTLAIWVAECPALTLPIFNEVAFELVTEVFPAYEGIFHQVYVRIRDLPIEDNLRDLRQIHLHALIKIKGVVTKRTGIYPQMKKVYYFCKCGERKGPIFIDNSESEIKLGN